MAKETMALGESLGASVIKAPVPQPAVKTRHRVIAYVLLCSIVVALGYLIFYLYEVMQ